MAETYRRRFRRFLERKPKSMIEYKDLPAFGLFVWAHMNVQCLCAFVFMNLVFLSALADRWPGNGNKIIADASQFVILLSGCFQRNIVSTGPFWILKTISWAANEEMKSRELKLSVNMSAAVLFISYLDLFYCLLLSLYVNRHRNVLRPDQPAT